MPYQEGQPFELQAYKGDLEAEQGGLVRLDWVQALLGEPGVVPVLTAGALVSKDSELPPDHMFSAFLKVGLLQDMLCLYHAGRQEFHTLITLGDNVCGHPRITHGGMTAAIVDESLGGLTYMLKRDGVVGKGPAFTVHLEVGYKAPVPAASHIVCCAKLESSEGRKTWATATVCDRPGGTLYATARALFVIPKEKKPDAGQGPPAEPLSPRQTETSLERMDQAGGRAESNGA